MDIDSLAQRVWEQANRLFPARTDQSMFFKMYEELGELIGSNPQSRPSELADVFIMLLDYAAAHNINLSAAIMQKMAINDRRKFAANELGVYTHVDS